MANRTRSIQINFSVTSKEKELIEKRQEQTGIKNRGDFLRKMAIDGYVIKPDYSDIKNLTVAINRIGNNINQITRKVNESGKIYQDDMTEINSKMGEVWLLLKSTLSKQL
jgi:hypothetical protein